MAQQGEHKTNAEYLKYTLSPWRNIKMIFPLCMQAKQQQQQPVVGFKCKLCF